MTLRSQDPLEEILFYDENTDLEKEIHACMGNLLTQFNRRVLDVIGWIEVNTRKKKSLFTTLQEGFNGIIGKSKNKSPEDIKQTVLVNCARLIHLSETRDISILPIFWNLILKWINHSHWVRIGTISIRGNTEAWWIKGWFYMDSIEKIYSDARRLTTDDVSQNI